MAVFRAKTKTRERKKSLFTDNVVKQTIQFLVVFS